MSSPRDRDGSDDGSEWQEPAHLSGDDPTGDQPNFADRRKTPRDDDHVGDAERPELQKVVDHRPARPMPVISATASGPHSKTTS